MWQGWGYGIGGQVYDKDGHKWQGLDMWQGVEASGRVWGHGAGMVTGCGDMWQGMGACSRMWTHVAGNGVRVLGHVAGGGHMW